MKFSDIAKENGMDEQTLKDIIKSNPIASSFIQRNIKNGNVTGQGKKAIQEIIDTYKDISNNPKISNTTDSEIEEKKEPIKEKENAKSTVTDHLGNTYPSIEKKCQKYNINVNTYSKRKKSGWSEEKALTTPVKTQNSVKNTSKKSSKLDQYIGRKNINKFGEEFEVITIEPPSTLVIKFADGQTMKTTASNFSLGRAYSPNSKQSQSKKNLFKSANTKDNAPKKADTKEDNLETSTSQNNSQDTLLKDVKKRRELAVEWLSYPIEELCYKTDEEIENIFKNECFEFIIDGKKAIVKKSDVKILD